MESERETLKRVLMIIIILVLLLLLTRCVYQERKLTNTEGKVEDIISLTEEQKLIIEMKQDESDLKNLYQRANICSEQRIEDFLALANKGEIVLLNLKREMGIFLWLFHLRKDLDIHVGGDNFNSTGWVDQKGKKYIFGYGLQHTNDIKFVSWR